MKKTVSLSVKKSDFLAKASAIPDVAAADVTVYSGKQNDSGTTYDPALGTNVRRIEVKLPDNLTDAKYLRVRANYTGSLPATLGTDSGTTDFTYTATNTITFADIAAANRITSGFTSVSSSGSAPSGNDTTGSFTDTGDSTTSDGYVVTVSETDTKGFDTYAVFKFTVAPRQSDGITVNATTGTQTKHHDWAPVALDLKFTTVSGAAILPTRASAS